MAYSETVEGVDVLSEGQSLSSVSLHPRALAADAETDGAAAQLFRVAPSAPVEGVLTLRAQLQRRLAAAGWICGRWVRTRTAPVEIEMARKHGRQWGCGAEVK